MGTSSVLFGPVWVRPKKKRRVSNTKKEEKRRERKWPCRCTPELLDRPKRGLTRDGKWGLFLADARWPFRSGICILWSPKLDDYWLSYKNNPLFLSLGLTDLDRVEWTQWCGMEWGLLVSMWQIPLSSSLLWCIMVDSPFGWCIGAFLGQHSLETHFP